MSIKNTNGKASTVEAPEEENEGSQNLKLLGTATIAENPTTPTIHKLERLEAVREKLLYMEKINALHERRQKLLNSLQKLRNFKLQKDEDGNNLTINDYKGTQFETGNSDVITEVMAMVQKIVESKLIEIENAILA